jgi:CheY-like chemotaxis protein
VVPDSGGPQPHLGASAAATVAVVDDDAAIRLVCRVALELAGFAVVEAVDGEAGLDLVRAESPQLALVDVMMPRRDGVSVARALRDDPATAGIPVVLMSAATSSGEIANVGAAAFLAKPFDPATLIELVTRLVGRRRPR